MDVVATAIEELKEGFLAVKMNASEEMNYIDSFSKVQAVIERVAYLGKRLAPSLASVRISTGGFIKRWQR